MAAVSLLEARGLRRYFDGLKAVDGVDLDLVPGEVHALIGPNGAGKTTLVSLLSGRIAAQAGTIRFAGEDITRLPAHRRVRRGIAYTFQITSVYARLSLTQNVALAVQSRGGDLAREVPEALARVGLGAEAGALAGTLSYGHQRLLEVAMGLALHPRLLILDEPTQGLAAGEIAAFKALVAGLAPATTVLLIEHNMEVVMDLATRITVLNFGRVLASGSPAAIRADAAVQAAYLGGRMLTISDIAAGYGPVRVLEGLSLTVPAGQVTCVMGRNGAGKSTMLKAVMGLVRVEAGAVTLAGARIEALAAHRVAGLGIGYVPQGRRLFGGLTVAENIAIGLRVRGHGAAMQGRVLDLFPRLRERLGQMARTLSGGEQQMLAVARALCVEPRVLMLDEPTEGLQPSMIALIREVVLRLKAEGVAVLLVEQRVDAVLAMADRVAFMTGGRVAEVVPAAGLRPEAPEFARYVGV